MFISLLGVIIASEGGQETSVRSNPARTLLAVLALSSGEVVATDQLIDELWGERPLGNVRNALHVNVVRLRRFLDSVGPGRGGRLVHTSSHGYLLALPPECVDAKVFEVRADRAVGLLSSSPVEAVAELRAALGLWRGAALLDAGEGLRCRAAAARLDERRLEVRKRLIEFRLDRGADDGLVSDLKQLRTEHPTDERLSELLMVGLYRTGRQGEALAVFQSVRSWLHAELGVEPGPGLRRVQQAILAQEHRNGIPDLVATR
jgi:SARP family transcriptional regulator, regulator of embCAB operon